jgi:hypothetical protein
LKIAWRPLHLPVRLRKRYDIYELTKIWNILSSIALATQVCLGIKA